MSHRNRLRSVAPIDAGKRRELKRLRNICWACSTRWWSRTVRDKCPKCGASFTDRDRWRSQTFTPDRLRAAREWRSLEVAELTRIVGMPIAEMEDGTVIPTRAQILQLANALGFPPGWMTLPAEKPERGPMFICRRPEACYVCGMLAYVLCDFRKSGGETCDRPMCEDHGACTGRSEGGDTIDLCDHHRGIKHDGLEEPLRASGLRRDRRRA